MLNTYDDELLAKAQNKLYDSIVYVHDISEINDDRLYCGFLCDNPDCETNITNKKIKPLCRPFDQARFGQQLNVSNNCICCASSLLNDDAICLISRTF